MKSHVKRINSFLAENESPEELELRTMGFDSRHKIRGEDEIKQVLRDLFLSNDRVLAAYDKFIKELDKSCAELKADYSWNEAEMESVLDIYAELGRGYPDSIIYVAVSDKVKELNDELGYNRRPAAGRSSSE